MNVFSQRIKELRLSRNLSLKEVAKIIGMSLMAYAHYEYGDRQPSIETIVKLCDLYDVSADYLIGRTDSY
jgi:transcriptional regulator with XRE-family HTH domain